MTWQVEILAMIRSVVQTAVVNNYQVLHALGKVPQVGPAHVITGHSASKIR